MRNVVQQSFVVFTIGEKSYTVVYQKYMKENVVSSEISIQNKVEMSFQMERHRTYFRTRGWHERKSMVLAAMTTVTSLEWNKNLLSHLFLSGWQKLLPETWISISFVNIKKKYLKDACNETWRNFPLFKLENPTIYQFPHY